LSVMAIVTITSAPMIILDNKGSRFNYIPTNPGSHKLKTLSGWERR
jgi:hypothetical protein